MKYLTQYFPFLPLKHQGTRHLLILLSAQGAYLQYWQGKQMQYSSFFSHQHPHLSAFAQFVQRHPYCCTLLLDVSEEEFHYEQIPALPHHQRQSLLKRKLQQRYPQTPFQNWQLDNSKQKVVYSALTRPELLQPWLDVLAHSYLPISGIHSLPLLSRQLAKPFEHTLIVSWQKDSGLRFNYCQQQQLRMSRLTPLSTNQVWGEQLQQELPRTLSYLRSQGLVGTGQTLHVQILCHPQEQTQLSQQLAPNPAIQYHWLNLNHQDASHFWLQQLHQQRPRLHYSPAALRREYHYWRALQHGNWLALSLLLLLIGWLWSQQSALSAQSEQQTQLSQQLSYLQQQNHSLQQSLPTMPASSDDIRHSVVAMQRWQKNNPQASHILPRLSQVIEQFPQLELQQLSWDATLPLSSSPSEHKTDHLMTRIRLEAELTGFSHDYPAALRYQQQLEQALQKAGYRITRLTSPLTSQSTTPLNTSDSVWSLHIEMEET